jgi:hypothetical protein
MAAQPNVRAALAVDTPLEQHHDPLREKSLGHFVATLAQLAPK